MKSGGWERLRVMWCGGGVVIMCEGEGMKNIDDIVRWVKDGGRGGKGGVDGVIGIY